MVAFDLFRRTKESKMAHYDDLAASAERGDLTPIAGTVLRGSRATEAGRLALLAATDTERF